MFTERHNTSPVVPVPAVIGHMSHRRPVSWLPASAWWMRISTKPWKQSSGPTTRSPSPPTRHLQRRGEVKRLRASLRDCDRRALKELVAAPDSVRSRLLINSLAREHGQVFLPMFSCISSNVKSLFPPMRTVFPPMPYFPHVTIYICAGPSSPRNTGGHFPEFLGTRVLDIY